ncbi:MAG: sigma-70 family RNA polymerase sigma factor [Planctomycetes bacterium]|nr:sigma-70 family RNA polymerase sigma factor [Planctomycetota bacterium]
MPEKNDETNDSAQTQWSRILGRDYDYLVRRFWGPVHRYLSGKLSSKDEAEELTQDVFLAFVERDLLARARPEEGSFRRFVFHVAHRFLIDRYRQAGTRKRGAGRKVSLDALATEIAAAGPTPDEAFDREWYVSLFRTARRAVRSYYERLGRTEGYAVFRLFFFGDERPGRLSHDEIARRLSLTPDQVRNLVRRSKLVFLDALELAVAEYAPSEEEKKSELADLARHLAGGGLPADLSSGLLTRLPEP